MNSKKNKNLLTFAVVIISILIFSHNFAAAAQTHVWQMQEITFEAANTYDNYYADVTCWIELKGPNFSKRIYGFWDGGKIYRVRFVATEPGTWKWTSGSNQSDDNGLNNIKGCPIKYYI